MYIHSRNSDDPVIKTLYIKYHPVLNKVTKEARKQLCSRLTAKSDNEIRSTWNIKNCLGKIRLTEEMPTILAYNEKVKDPKKVADAFKSFFLTASESFNLHQVRKEDVIFFLKDWFPFMKFIETTEAEIKSTLHFF